MSLCFSIQLIFIACCIHFYEWNNIVEWHILKSDFQINLLPVVTYHENFIIFNHILSSYSKCYWEVKKIRKMLSQTPKILVILNKNGSKMTWFYENFNHLVFILDVCFLLSFDKVSGWTVSWILERFFDFF